MDVFDTIYQNVLDTKVPTLFLGSGSSIGTGKELGLETNFPSMSELARRYIEDINSNSKWGDQEKEFWDHFVEEFEGFGDNWRKFNLEDFLLKNPLNENSIL